MVSFGPADEWQRYAGRQADGCTNGSQYDTGAQDAYDEATINFKKAVRDIDFIGETKPGIRPLLT